MFGWFRRKRAGARQEASTAGETPPPRLGVNRANPGFMPRGSVAFTNGRRKWQESFDCVQSLARLMEANGHRPRVDGDLVLDEGTGLSFRPLLADFNPIETGGVRTTTTIEVTHGTVIPSPTFEYQHSTGETTPASIEEGFDQWCKTDLVTLADATRPDLRDCTAMSLEFPAEGGRPARKRRVVLGPVAHLREHPPEPAATEAEAHPFCPCCLLTQSFDAFTPLIEGGGFVGLRMFAMRGPTGSPDADCRTNGEDFPPGKAALARYVTTWPGTGIEFRKQFVVIQDVS